MTYKDEIAKLVGDEVTLTRKGIAFTILEVPSPPAWPLGAIGKQKTKFVASFSLQQLPGCCGICVSYHATVNVLYRKKGIGNLLNKFRQQLAWDSGYTVLLCTDVETNIPQQAILAKNGWTKLMTFKNRRTTNKVSIHTIELKDSKIAGGFSFEEGLSPKV